MKVASLAAVAVLALALRADGSCVALDDGWSGEMRSEKGLVLRRAAIRLPHNWDDYFGMRGFRHGNLHGTATYRRAFVAPSLAGRRSFLVFDGAGTYLTVRLNGRTLCTRRPAGRLVTTIETTGVAKEGVNELEAVCDHPSEIQDMPWHCGGCSGIGSEGPEPFGLFRKVRFETTDDVRIAPFGVHVWHDGDCRTAHVLWQKALRAWDARDHVCGHFLWTLFSHENPGRLSTNVDDSYRVVDKVGPLNPKGIYTLWGARVAAWYMYRAYGDSLANGKLDEVRYRPLSWFVEEGRRLVAPPAGQEYEDVKIFETAKQSD